MSISAESTKSESGASPWLTNATWNERAFTKGWTALSQSAAVREPATREVLGRVAIASGDDIAAASKLARTAQAAWAMTAYEERAAVLRKAADIAEGNREEIIDWIIRESGSILPKAEFELVITIKALREASAMPSQAQGQVLPSEPVG